MQTYLHPGFILYLPLIIILKCFTGNTLVKVLENGKEVEKEIKDVKKDEKK